MMRCLQGLTYAPANSGELIGQAAPLADVTDWLMDPLERGLFFVLQSLATAFWNLDRALLTAAVQIYSWRNAIVDPNGLLTKLVGALTADPTILSLLGGALTLALLLAALMFGLRFLAGQQFEIVDLKKVAMWMVLVGALLTNGPGLIGDLESSRQGLNTAAYQVATSVNGAMDYSNPELPNGAPGDMGPLTHLFANTTRLGAGQLDGIDLAASYLFAGEGDLNGTVNAGSGLPPGVMQKFFRTCAGTACATPWPDNGMDEQARQDALAKAFDGLVRMFTGFMPVVFALEQPLVYLTLAVATAILLTALLATLMFAFFRPTESLPIAILQSYLRLFILTYLLSLFIGLLVGFLKFWADSNSWVAFLGASWFVAALMLPLVLMSFKTINQALTAALHGQNPSPSTRALRSSGAAPAGSHSGVGSSRPTGPGGTRGGGAAGPEERDPAPASVAPPGAAPARASSRQPGELAATELVRATGTPAAGEVLPGDEIRAMATQPGGHGAGHGQVLDGEYRVVGERAGTGDDPQRALMNRYLVSQGIAPVESTPRVAEGGPAPFALPAPVEMAPGTSSAEPAGPTRAPDAASGTQDSTPAAGLPPGATRRAPPQVQATPNPAMQRALADLPNNSGPLPPALQSLPPATQQALSRIREGGYDPQDTAAVVRAVQSVTQGLQQRGAAGAIPGYFLNERGQLDLESPGMQAVRREAGEAAWSFTDSPQGQADLQHLAGAGLGLQRTYPAAAVADAIGQAVEHRGDAGTAAAALGVAPSAAWGSRTSAVQGVIQQAPTYGLTNAADVQRFIALAQAHDPVTLAAGVVPGLTGDEQQLLARVQKAVAVAGADPRGGASGRSQAAQGYQTFLQDIRALPTAVTAPVVPVAPPVAPPEHGAAATRAEKAPANPSC